MTPCDITPWAEFAMASNERSFRGEHGRRVRVEPDAGERIQLFHVDREPAFSKRFGERPRCDLAILRETATARVVAFVELKGGDWGAAENQLMSMWNLAQGFPRECRADLRFIIAGESRAVPRQRRDGKRGEVGRGTFERQTRCRITPVSAPRGQSVDISRLLR